MPPEIEREPCPHCGEPAALTGRICPHCRGNLQVAVLLDAAPPDSRARYQLARRLASFDPPPISFLAAQEALAIPRSVLAARVTRDEARRLVALVDEHGGRAHTEGAGGEPAATTAPFKWLGLAVLALACVLAIVALGKNARRARSESLTTTEIAARATPATVMLRCSNSLGTGFFVTDELVLTNAHVVCRSGDPLRAVLSTGRDVEAQVVRRDDWLDLALVRLPGAGITPLPLGDATALHVGDPVTVIGTPQGLQLTVHQGIVSHKARRLFGISYIQIEASINGGNSGGPLLDPQGRVVGIVSARLTQSEGLGFALPINYAYAGERRLLAPPDQPAPNQAAWRALLENVSEEDRREVSRIGLVGAILGTTWMGSYSGIDAVEIALIRQGSGPPDGEMLHLTLRSKGQVLCSAAAPSAGWHPLGGRLETEYARYFQWLRRMGMDEDIFQGSVRFVLAGCPSQELGMAEMTLENAKGRFGQVGAYGEP